MEMADFWLLEKQLVHKLFKVLVPRYEHYNVSFTRMLKAPKPYPGKHYDRALLELRGNPYPSLLPDHQNKNLIHNILLDEAKKAYRIEKYAQIAAKIDEAEKTLTSGATKMDEAAPTLTSNNAAQGQGKQEKNETQS